MTGKPPWTISTLLRWSAAYLEEKAFASPRLESELLLAHCLGCDRLYLYLNTTKPLIQEELSRFKGLIKRRLDHEPVAYITGRKGFWSMDLAVGPGVLVPRPETETLVEAALARLQPDAEAEAAELGTGSGAVALALARERPRLRLTATDISGEALAFASLNAEKQGLAGRIEFRQGDLFEALAGRRYDLVVMNPPYVSESEYQALAPDITQYEPKEALLAGGDGLSVITRLAAGAGSHLNPGGSLLFEIGAAQGGVVRKILVDGGWTRVEILPDLAGRDRVASARLAS